MSWTVALSGPENTRAQAELALETARIPILPISGPCPCGGSDGKGCPHANRFGEPVGHHALMDWQRKFPDDEDVFLTVIAEHPDEAVTAVEKAGWRLRVHYETPDPPQPDPLVATLAEMRAEIAALKAKVGG